MKLTPADWFVILSIAVQVVCALFVRALYKLGGKPKSKRIEHLLLVGMFHSFSIMWFVILLHHHANLASSQDLPDEGTFVLLILATGAWLTYQGYEFHLYLKKINKK